MTTGVPADPAASREPLPSWTLTSRQLGDLELILSGAFAPLRAFMNSKDVESVGSNCSLADGTPWPVAVTLDIPAEVAMTATDRLLLADPEGTPLAVLSITERAPAGGEPDARSGPDGRLIRLAGPVTPSRPVEHGAFRRLMISPEQARAELGAGPVLAFATRAPLGSRQIGQLKHLADQLRAKILLLPLAASPAAVVREPESLIRAVLAAAARLPAGTLVVPVPLASRDGGADATFTPRELAAAAIVAGAYGATHLMADDLRLIGGLAGGPPAGAGGASHALAGKAALRPAEGGEASSLRTLTGLPGARITVVTPGEWAFDRRAEVWRPLHLIESGTEIGDLSADELGDMLDTGADLPAWFAPESVVKELRHARPPRSQRGFVLFLTGLSGSGKSTIARDLRDLLAERGDRRVTLLDGDLVRSLLSAGLTFSRADRDLNIARIGYVAAEIARHGGIAICAPIAPYAAARDQVRQMVSQVGDFLLIHVATPLAACEARDRKGLYAKARAGLIPQFTGVSDPYEEPSDAVLTLDTSVASREECADAVMSLLVSGGWLARSEAS